MRQAEEGMAGSQRLCEVNPLRCPVQPDTHTFSLEIHELSRSCKLEYSAMFVLKLVPEVVQYPTIGSARVSREKTLKDNIFP